VSANLVRQIEQITLKRIENDALALPTLPAMANRVFAALSNPQLSAAKATETVQLDALLTARFLRQASTLGLSRDKRPTILEAITRIGMPTLRGSLYETAMSQFELSRDPKIAAAVGGLWGHAAAVATLSRDLATLGGLGDPDVAYLAGLLHDLGKPVVATVLLAAEKQMVTTKKKPWISAADWVAVVEGAHRKIGLALAEKWELPEPVIKCIRDSSEYDNSDRTSVTNLVVLANALAKRERIHVGAVDLEDVEAIIMIGRSLLGVNTELIEKVCAGIRTRAEVF